MNGSDGTDGAPGTAFAYAYILGNGTLVTDQSKNVVGAVRENTGTYCIELSENAKVAVGATDTAHGGATKFLATAVDVVEVQSVCETPLPGSNAAVKTFDAAGAASDAPFFVMFEK
jgi:hypothetical protein